MKSLWTNEIKLPSFKQLKDDITTEVLIIGGGLAGVLCAYFLQEAGVKYVLVEGKTICSGITKNTTAKITSQHGLIYDKMIKSKGSEYAKKYLAVNEKALSKYAELCQNIECDFIRKNAYVYSLSDREKIKSEVEAVCSLGFPAEYTEHVQLPISVEGAICFPNQAQFHPLKFVREIAQGLNIYEHTFVKEMTTNTAVTNTGNIRAEKIIVTTHFPFINNHGNFFLKMYQHRSYVLALENAAQVDGMYLEDIQNGKSFRNYNNLLLIGGGDHRTGKKGGNWQELREFAKIHYPEAKEKFYWATQDCMTLDGIPYIGHYSNSTPNLYVATGFNKWGMSSSMVSAMILTDMILGRENPYQEIFSPSRNILKPQLFINLWETLANFVSLTTRRCPHLGCALKWNPYEHTWDCPCHGSRFSEEGEVIDNPANGDLKDKN